MDVVAAFIEDLAVNAISIFCLVKTNASKKLIETYEDALVSPPKVHNNRGTIITTNLRSCDTEKGGKWKAEKTITSVIFAVSINITEL